MEKIAFVTRGFSTGKGGVASYSVDFVQAFKNKYSFVVITGDNYLKKNEDPFRVYNHNLNSLTSNNAKSLLEIIKNESPDIVINSYATLLSCIVPFLPSNIKLISISHFVDSHIAKIAGFNFQYINSIIALSTFGKEFIEKYYCILDKSKTSVVLNFMEQSHNNDYANKKNRKILKIVYPGGTDLAKKPEIVAKALIKLLKTDLKFEFYWLGNPLMVGNKIPFNKIKSIRQIIPEDNRIKQLGRVERELSKQILEESNIFILPSIGEGCPISLIEAMRGGCISIISDAKHGSLDIIENNISGLIIPKNDSGSLFRLLKNIILNHHQYLHIYDGSKLRFELLLEKSIWQKNMQQIINNCSSDIQRLSSFNYLYFTFCRLKLYKILTIQFIYDKFINFRLFISFRIIYIKNSFLK